jgi:hypothetical protein
MAQKSFCPVGSAEISPAIQLLGYRLLRTSTQCDKASRLPQGTASLRAANSTPLMVLDLRHAENDGRIEPTRFRHLLAVAYHLVRQIYELVVCDLLQLLFDLHERWRIRPRDMEGARQIRGLRNGGKPNDRFLK